jgi:hypothetical protein
MIRSAFVAAALLGAVTPAVAGGSSDLVRVLGLSIYEDTSYVLIVAPVRSLTNERATDPYFGNCERFKVHGTFSRLKGAWPWSSTLLSRHMHLEALAYLDDAQRNRQVVQFGWMGNGFVAIEEGDPCVVRSRGLRLFDDHGKIAVLSFHDVV